MVMHSVVIKTEESGFRASSHYSKNAGYKRKVTHEFYGCGTTEEQALGALMLNAIELGVIERKEFVEKQLLNTDEDDDDYDD